MLFLQMVHQSENCWGTGQIPKWEVNAETEQSAHVQYKCVRALMRTGHLLDQLCSAGAAKVRAEQ